MLTMSPWRIVKRRPDKVDGKKTSMKAKGAYY